jgi:hypothetical protein
MYFRWVHRQKKLDKRHKFKIHNKGMAQKYADLMLKKGKSRLGIENVVK